MRKQCVPGVLFLRPSPRTPGYEASHMHAKCKQHVMVYTHIGKCAICIYKVVNITHPNTSSRFLCSGIHELRPRIPARGLLYISAEYIARLPP